MRASSRAGLTPAWDEQQAACRAPTSRSLRWNAAICAGHRRRRAGRSAATHCRSRLRVAGAASRPAHGAPHRRASSAEAHGIVSDSGRIAEVTTRTPEHTTGSRDRLRLCAAPAGVSRDYGRFSAPRPNQAIPGPDERSSSTRQKPRDPAFIGHCGRWRDPDSNRDHHDFQTDASNHRTGRNMPANARVSTGRQRAEVSRK